MVTVGVWSRILGRVSSDLMFSLFEIYGEPLRLVARGFVWGLLRPGSTRLPVINVFVIPNEWLVCACFSSARGVSRFGVLAAHCAVSTARFLLFGASEASLGSSCVGSGSVSLACASAALVRFRVVYGFVSARVHGASFLTPSGLGSSPFGFSCVRLGRA